MSVFQNVLTQLLHEKLQAYLTDLQHQGVLEDQVIAYLNYLAGKPEVKPDYLPVRPGDLPRPEIYNQNFAHFQELVRLYLSWLQHLGDTELNLHNFLLSQYLGIQTQIKRLAGIVSDLALFQRDAAAGVRIYGDTFTTTDKVDMTSNRDFPPAMVDLTLGAVTLPPESQIIIPQVATVKLNPLSNGVPGNNHQMGIRETHHDLSVITDGNLDTWFEYETVSTYPRSQPLVLDITISYYRESLLNRLKIYLNNLGSTSWPRLLDIQSSLDGKNFLTLKDSLQTATQQPNPLEIEPLASKNGGLLVFVFLPRRVKHLRLIFQQSGYYLIQTNNGERYRYAIGLREITAAGVVYHKIGELISKPYHFNRPVRRVMLEAEEVLWPSSEVCQIQHYISTDGETWKDIQPVRGLRAEVPKVVIFEEQPATQLFYRAVLSRQESLTAVQALSQHTVETTEYSAFPTTPPYVINLSQIPEPNSVSVCLPHAGSAGGDTRFCLGVSDGSAHQTFTIPFEVTGQETIWVNRQRWQRVEGLTTYGPEGLVYVLNPVSRIVRFGNGVNGMIPPAGFRIYLSLPPERLLLSSGEVLTTRLKHQTTGRQEDVRIFQIGKPKAVNQELLARGATIIRLTHAPVIPGSISFSGEKITAFTTQKQFIDGSTELSTVGDYSVDYQNGVIYTRLATPLNHNCYASYQYLPRQEISPMDWAFVPGRTDMLELSPGAFRSEEVSLEDLHEQAGNYKITLANTHLIAGSLRFSTNARLSHELPFIDGVNEFAGIMLQQDESIPTGVMIFTLQHVPRQDYQVIFSDTVVFAREVGTIQEVTAAGTYWINYTNGEIHTYLPTRGGQVSYYYHHNISNLEQSFSVDYANGQIHLYKPLPQYVKVSYQYAHYEAEYYIAETIPSTAYEIRPEDKQIIIHDLHLIQRLRQRFSHEDALAVTYRYAIQEPPAAGALQMITPLLQSYGLRLLFQ